MRLVCYTLSRRCGSPEIIIDHKSLFSINGLVIVRWLDQEISSFSEWISVVPVGSVVDSRPMTADTVNHSMTSTTTSIATDKKCIIMLDIVIRNNPV